MGSLLLILDEDHPTAPSGPPDRDLHSGDHG